VESGLESIAGRDGQMDRQTELP